ncbi:unnamed protein product [Peniophora sp. CBMAI 1063]|nr:unnamed protein product [Peniophora sp. CBMAI 1063]
MTEERVITRKRKRAPGITTTEPQSQPQIETLPRSSPGSSPQPLVRVLRKRPGKIVPERARSESPDPIANLYDDHSRTASPEPVSPPITALGHMDSSFTIAATSDYDELPSSEPGPIEHSSDPLTIEQMLRRLTGKANLNPTRSRKSSKRRRLSGPGPPRSLEASSATRRKGKNANSRPVGFSDRLLMAAATSGVELADDAPCLPADGRKPLPFCRVAIDETARSLKTPLQENRRSTANASNTQAGSSRNKVSSKRVPGLKPKPLELVPLREPSVIRKAKHGNRR